MIITRKESQACIFGSVGCDKRLTSEVDPGNRTSRARTLGGDAASWVAGVEDIPGRSVFEALVRAMVAVECKVL